MKKNKVGVQKGTKRGSYSRTQSKRAKKEITLDGLSYQEIGVILNLSVDEVKTIEQQALKKLRLPNNLNKKFRNYCA